MFEDEVKASSLDPSYEEVSAVPIHYGSDFRQVGWVERDLIDVLEGARAAHHAPDFRTEHRVLAHWARPKRRVHSAIGKRVLAEQAPGLPEDQDLGMRRRIV